MVLASVNEVKKIAFGLKTSSHDSEGFDIWKFLTAAVLQQPQRFFSKLQSHRKHCMNTH